MNAKSLRTLKILEQMVRESPPKRRPKYMCLSHAARYYKVSRDKLIARAKAANAYFRITERRIIVDTDVMDQIFGVQGNQYDQPAEDPEDDVCINIEDFLNDSN